MEYGGILGGIKIPSSLEKMSDRPIERGKKLKEVIFRFLEGENLQFPIDLTSSSSWKPHNGKN